MHQKHPKIARPSLGNYARTEFALVGTTCELIEKIMADWSEAISDNYRCLMVTGDHQEAEIASSSRYDRKRFSSQQESWNEYDDRLLGSEYDLALVNGNHYPAAHQIVFVDENKAGTLKRRADELTDIFAVIHVSGDKAMPQWLQDTCDRQRRQPYFTSISILSGLLNQIAKELRNARPPLNALILAGGKSQRMGEDKAGLIYHDGKTEVERLSSLCVDFGVQPYLSLSDGNRTFGSNTPILNDKFLGMGPAGAICSAFQHNPNTAWLVLACDLPLLDAITLGILINARRTEKLATALRGPGEEWPEPLISIYEPRAYQRMLRFLSLGYSCPRKVLINSDIEIVELDDSAPITNANTPEERDTVLKSLE